MARGPLLLVLLLAAAAGAYGVVLLLEMPRGVQQATRKDRDLDGAPVTLKTARSWVYQLQGLERPGAVDRLVRAPVDLYVLEPTDTVRGFEDFPTRGMVARLHARQTQGRRRPLCLAYLNVGQAEDYRTYWQEAWRPSASTPPARKGFVLCPDPDGWKGNFPVAYWDPAWPPVLFGSPEALLDRILAQGFDGVYLDWVLGFADDFVASVAAREGVDPARAMVTLVERLRTYARRTHPAFLVVLQNPGDLIVRVPAMAESADGVAQEGLLFRGGATDDWDDPRAGGARRGAEGEDGVIALARLLRRYVDRGLPVFTADYAIAPADVRAALEKSHSFGFVPCVTRTPLDRVPAHVFPQD